MPTYQYQCPACGETKERVQRITDQPVRIQCECGTRMRRIISATNFVLNGKGWARDGYSKEGSR